MRLLEEWVEVVGFDNLNPCYDSSLKGVLIFELKDRIWPECHSIHSD